MLDLYYREQAPLPVDVQRIAKLIRMPEHAATVRDMLVEFFIESPEGYRNTRADREIDAYKRMADGGAKGAAKRWLKGADAPPIASQCPPQQNPNANHEPVTKNQEPRTKEVREEASPPQPAAPQKQKAKPATTLKTYLSRCRELGEKPVPEGHSIRKWARDAGITDEMLQIAWVKFKERYTEAEKGVAKSYKDWPGHFATSVKDNWFGVWFFGDDGLQWSSKGLTFRSVLDQQTRGGNEQG